MISVVDRVSTYPGRVKLTKANGTTEYVTWERADEPTVAGTPINKALFDSIAADIGLAANTTVFVSKSGSDTLGNGTSSNPYLTITKAISSLPKNLNGQTTVINIGAGTYNETVSFANFSAGTVIVNGNAGAGVTVEGFRVENCSVRIDGIALTIGSQGLSVTAKGMFYTANANITINGGQDGLTLRYGAVVEISTTLTINNTTVRAIQVQYASLLSVANLAGTGNSVGVHGYNSTIYIEKMTMGAVTPTVNNNATMVIKS